MIEVLIFLSSVNWWIPDSLLAFDVRDSGGEVKYYQHIERPKGHFSLSHEVLLGVLVFSGGLYYAAHAFRHSEQIKVKTGIAYLFIGMSGIGVGLSLIFTYGFSVH